MCAYLMYYIPSDINNDEYCVYDLMYLCIYYMAMKLIHCHCQNHSCWWPGPLYQRSLAAMALTMQDKWGFVLQEERVQLPTLSQWQRFIEYVNIVSAFKGGKLGQKYACWVLIPWVLALPNGKVVWQGMSIMIVNMCQSKHWKHKGVKLSYLCHRLHWMSSHNNFLQHQWWQSWHHKDSLVSVYIHI